MENFSIVLAVCRTAMQNPTDALKRHVDRLVKALEKQGDEDQAASLAKLLTGIEQSGKIEPSRVILSRQALNGETMPLSIIPPVDRETGASLATVLLPSKLSDVEPPILNESLQAAIDSLADEWAHLDKLKLAGIRPPLNCLIFGAPGTGKTKLAHVVASRLSLPLVTARLDGLISSFLGTTARNIATLFEFANRYKCILLLDEFDAVAKIRDDPHEVGEIKRVVNTLLQCLDERSSTGFTIAITNHEQLLDSAIWRRFDARIFVPKPDVVSRNSIVHKYLEGIEATNVERDFLAWITDGYSGAEIEALCNALKRYQVMREQSDFSVMDALRLNVHLSADHVNSPRRKLFLSDHEDLARVLADDIDFNFRQDELAQLFHKDQSTISRWLKRGKAA
jgi:ATPase family associated with various cellular activities (AAA)